ncbi:uncharacterized protein BDV14DRAFT_199276 [Aspergillus stella-maris]|uniref:uncharacterized protein n=1 Tax=Aspergillus stella-maris TaxID=1810926 RepID=UPI003CCDD13B
MADYHPGNRTFQYIRRDHPVHLMSDLFVLAFAVCGFAYIFWVFRELFYRLFRYLASFNNSAFVLTTGGDGKTQPADRANVHVTLRVHHRLAENLPRMVQAAREPLVRRLREIRREIQNAALERVQNRHALEQSAPILLRIIKNLHLVFAVPTSPPDYLLPEIDGPNLLEISLLTWEESEQQRSLAHYPHPKRAKTLELHEVRTINFAIEFPDASFVKAFAESVTNTSNAHVTSIDWIFFEAPSHRPEAEAPPAECQAPPAKLAAAPAQARAPPAESRAPRDEGEASNDG